MQNHIVVAKTHPEKSRLLYDPQTAGGLLIIMEAEMAEALVSSMKDRGYDSCAVIGEIVAIEKPSDNGGEEESCVLRKLVDVVE